jgi:hypothetical protein
VTTVDAFEGGCAKNTASLKALFLPFKLKSTRKTKAASLTHEALRQVYMIKQKSENKQQQNLRAKVQYTETESIFVE